MTVVKVDPSWLCADCVAERRADCALADPEHVAGDQPNARCWEPLQPGMDPTKPVPERAVEEPEPDAFTHTQSLECQLCDGVCDMLDTGARVDMAKVLDVLASPATIATDLVVTRSDLDTNQAKVALKLGLTELSSRLAQETMREELRARPPLRLIDLNQIEGKTHEEVVEMQAQRYRAVDPWIKEDQVLVGELSREFRRGAFAGAALAVVPAVLWAVLDRVWSR